MCLELHVADTRDVAPGQVSVPSIGFMCLEQVVAWCKRFQQIRFSTLNRVYVLGTCLRRPHPRRQRRFSTLNRVYVLGTEEHDGLFLLILARFSTLNRVYVLGTRASAGLYA